MDKGLEQILLQRGHTDGPQTYEKMLNVTNKTQNSNSKNMCTPMFITVLFTITKIWKQPKSPSVDEWAKQLWDIYTMEFYLDIKMKKVLFFLTKWVDLQNITLREIGQSEKRQTPYDFTPVWDLTNKLN